MNLRMLLPLLMLAACDDAVPAAPLAGARIGGPFTLTDEDGRTRTDRDFAGKYRIMYFGYTFCPDVCPVDVRNIAGGYRAFAKAQPALATRVVPIFVSVDPDRDTPAVLRQFTDAFDPAVIGLTGTAQQVADVARAYGVPYQAQRTPGNDNYLVDHGRNAYLMDPDGKPIALLSHDQAPTVIAAELSKWVR